VSETATWFQSCMSEDSNPSAVLKNITLSKINSCKKITTNELNESVTKKASISAAHSSNYKKSLKHCSYNNYSTPSNPASLDSGLSSDFVNVISEPSCLYTTFETPTIQSVLSEDTALSRDNTSKIPAPKVNIKLKNKSEAIFTLSLSHIFAFCLLVP
jgi:hypothetical protein